MRTAPLSKNLPVPVLPGCCANTRGTAAMAVAAAPVFSILRLIGSILGVLMAFSRLTCEMSRASQRHDRTDCWKRRLHFSVGRSFNHGLFDLKTACRYRGSFYGRCQRVRGASRPLPGAATIFPFSY